MRRTAVASFLFFLLAGSAAWGQTTTSSTSTTAPASSTTTTTTGGGTGRPPAATLASAAGQVTALQGSYCWPQPSGTSICADTLFLDPPEALTVRQGETLSLRFQTSSSPTAISLQRFERPNGPSLETITVPAGNPARFRADLPSGVWILVAFTRWAEGDASYFFKVDVRAAPGSPNQAPPAKPTPAPPRFTG
jgi:hypothetical protein